MRSGLRRISQASLLLVLLLPSLARATVYPCTEAGLDSGLAAGGLVQFSCAAGSTIALSASKTVGVSGTDIEGQGNVTFQGGANFQLFFVSANVTVTFRDLAITGANVAALGAVLSGGAGSKVTLDQVSLTNDNASTGGAVVYSSSGTVTVTNSTFSGGNGNALMGDAATLSMTSSTISTLLRGVVARNGTTATISHSTIVGENTGVQAVGATDSISLGHVLFSNNAADTSGATVTSTGFNVIEDAFTGAQATDIVGVPARVAALAANGGPTETVALLACSPAIDAGQSPATLPTDQRGAGFPRVLQARQDIGAFESNFTAIPCITTQPLPQTLFATQTLTLTVAAITGTGTLTYQWRHNGTAIAGATAATYTKTAVLADAGSYDVIVTNSVGSVTSNAVTVTVNGPPAITTQPTAQTLFATQTLTLSVTATGLSLTYQWRRNATAIVGATAATYTKTAVVADAGSYDVIVKNPAGSVTSNAVAVTVNGPPAITTQPTAQAVFATQTLTLSVAATGASLAYQWRLNATDIAGATSATYTKTAALSDAGNYDVVISNPAGSVTSNAVAVTVDGPPAITTQPVGVELFAGSPFTLTVAATGASLAYQWRLGGTAIAGATQTTFMVATAAATDAGDYDVIVSNGAGSVTSQIAHVTVDGPPVVTTNPTAVTLFAGQPLTLTVGATGNMLSYQWRKDGATLALQTAATLSVAAVALTDAGAYDCVVTNPAGSATSASAAVTVNGPPVITRQPVGVAVTEGNSFELDVEATGESLTYQWQKDGVPLGSATGASFSVAAATMADAGSYSVVVTNPAGSVTSDTVPVTVMAVSAKPGGGGGCGCDLGGRDRLPRGTLLLAAALALLAAIRRKRGSRAA